jgi:hypothetical protein
MYNMFLPHKKLYISEALGGISLLLGLLAPAVQAQDWLQPNREPTARVLTAVKPVPQWAVKSTKALLSTQQQANIAAAGLPLWTFFTESPRDFLGYTGAIVGRDPFSGGGSVSVPTYVVPLIIVTNTVATGIDSKGQYITEPGVTTFDPTVPDHACLTEPNNVPLTLLRESPLFENAAFNFGGTEVGKTQYTDAFQRAQFWQALGDAANDYHTLLSPVQVVTPVTINVPAERGLARPAQFTGGRTLCAPHARVDIEWFDTYLNEVVLPALSAQGVAPANLPVFFASNTVWALKPVDPSTCCIGGYHSGTFTVPIQTYAVGDFDVTGLFGAGSLIDTVILSHELAEWINDPFINNLTPAWGNTGQVVGACQNNLEVGDPLTGSESPRIAMPNGFTYHLQELAFFSWFFGAPSVGVNGWFSNNGTFLTDAGPPCQTPTTSSSVNVSGKWIIR